MNWPLDLIEAGIDHLEHFFGIYIRQYLDEYEDLMTDYAREFAISARDSNAQKYFHSVEIAGQMYTSFGTLMRRYNLFVCPTNALAAVKAEHDQSKDEVLINGKSVNPILGWVMTLPFNMLSRCPVISLPSGRTAEQLPTGIQLVGATYRDKDVFQAAMAFENAVGAWYADGDNRPDL